jgi:hypothetical protein
MPHSPDDLANLTPEQRRREIAVILAKGILRLHSVGLLAPDSTAARSCEDAPEIVENGLDVSAAPRPDVTGS